MSTVIRLARFGAKKRPFYHVVVTSSRSPRDSNFIEKLGTYNPLLEGDKRLTLKADRVKHWLSVGAKPSDRVHLFLNQAGIVSTKPSQKTARKSKKDKGEAAAA